MVKLIKHIKALLRLIRWPNLAIMIITQVFTWKFIIVPILHRAYMEPQLANMEVFFLILATFSIAAGGYAINDYFDRKIDRINKPTALIVGTLIEPRFAIIYHMLFTAIGVLTGLWVAVRIDQIYLSLVFFMASGLLWFYSTIYKRELLLGNVIVALLTASVPFLMLLYELPLLARNYGSDASPITRYLMIWVLGFGLFAFLLNLIREIVKDSEDFEGDQAYGKMTIPVIWGIKTARWISILLIAIIIGFLSVAWFFFIRDNITIVYFIVALVIPLCIVAYKLITGSDKRMFHSASIWLKFIMVTGLGYMIIVNLIIKRLQ